MNQRVLKVGAAAVLFAAAGVVASAEPRVSVPQAGPVLRVDRVGARADLQRAYPGVMFFEGDTRTTRVYGRAFSTGATAVESVEAFLQAHVAALGVNYADVASRGVAQDGSNSVQLMPRDDGSMKFTMLAYTQVRDGVPVYRSELRALTRNEPGNPLVLVSNATFDLGDFRVDAAVAANPNMQAAAAAVREALPAVDLMGEGLIQDERLVIWAGTEKAPASPRLALAFVARTHASAGVEGFGAWEVVADAATGAIISTEDMLCHEDVTGRVVGQATQGIKSAECNAEDLTGLKDLRVTAGAVTTFTDADGNYRLTGVPTGPVTVSASARGQRFRVYSPGSDAPATTVNASSPGVAPDLVLNSANSSEVRRAEVNAYLQHTVVRDLILSASPAYPVISTQTEWRVNVSVAGTCNAYYMANDSTNFFNAGGGCPNTAYYDVCHHEYGHHLVQSGGSLQDQYGEGTADCMGVLISDQPVLGWGFFNNCDAGLRDARAFRTYPCSAEIHDCGQLISGCLWDTRNAMVAAGITDYRDVLKRLTINAVPLHAGSGSIAPDITIDWLTLDDTDGSITNGTPHYTQIQAGFAPHNMGGPALDLGHIDLPEGTPTMVHPDSSADGFRVVVTGVAAVPVDGDATLLWRIAGGAENRTSLHRIGVNEYTAFLPPTPCLSTVQFAVIAGTSGGLIRNPVGNGYYTAISASRVVTRYANDFSTDMGWNTSQSVAGADGAWVRARPAASTGAPGADFGGDGLCYVTGNRVGEDVDGQTVRVFSPRLDARGGAMYLSYARWVNLGAGASTRDTMKVEVDGSAGSAVWTTLEEVSSTTPDVNRGWVVKEFALPDSVKNTRFQVRFGVTDAGVDTLVEGAIDSVRLIEYVCDSCAPDFNGDGFLDFFDYDDYVSCFESGNCPAGKTADFNGDGFADFFDYDDFVSAFEAGC